MTAAALTLGTAGHIDHGKTRLVEALTGTDTDRLPEEKRRGISIALGYALLELPDGRALSVIDVPGHERFVRTMVAGATGIDMYLLVVDAGEGVKPQTYEHLRVLGLLGVNDGVVALTKIDVVAPERVAAAEHDVRALVPGIDVVSVSAVTGVGLDLLRDRLADLAARVARTRGRGEARLYVDRTFSLPGAGPVVTGTLWSGEIAAGDRLDVLPAGFGLRVRGVEVHGQSAERARAGQRVALAYTADRHRRPAPGDAIVAPGAYAPSYRLDVTLLDAEAVRDGAHVTVCHGTSAVAARVVRVGAAAAQLRLARPLVAARGDRVVLRGETTLGGGVVLDPLPPRRVEERRLALLERGDAAALATALVDSPVERRRLGLRLAPGEAELVEASDEVVVSGEWLWARSWLESERARVRALLEARRGEVDPGMGVRALFGDAPWAAEVAPLLGLDADRGRLYLPGERASAAGLDGELAASLAAAGTAPVAVADGELARQLEREGRLVRLGDGLAITPEAYRAFRQALVEESERAGGVTLAAFRDRAGVSRRVAQLVLERFDADRVTLRVGDARRLRRGARQE